MPWLCAHRTSAKKGRVETLSDRADLGPGPFRHLRGAGVELAPEKPLLAVRFRQSRNSTVVRRIIFDYDS